MNQVLRALSVFAKRSTLAGKLGWFDGKRDPYKAFGWKETITYEDCLEAYKRQGLVSRLVAAYPDAIWGQPPRILGNEQLHKEINGAKQIGAGDEVGEPGGLADTIGLFAVLNRAERLAALGKYSVILLGFDDVSSKQDMEQPVRAPAKLNFMQVYSYREAQITRLSQDASDPNFGRPELYTIQQKIETDHATFSEHFQVHHSRVLHVTDTILDSDILGVPLCERLFNDLHDLMKISGGSAEMMWLAANKGLQIDVDKEMEFTKDQAEALKDEVNDYVHNLSRVLRTRGVTINDIGADSINPEPVFRIIVNQISATTAIPQRIFIGSEAGKLASEQDRANWASRIHDRRAMHAEPRIFRPLVAKLQAAGAVAEGEYWLSWPDAFRQNPLETAQTAAQQARSAINVARAAREIPKLITKREARAIVLATGDVDAVTETEDPNTAEFLDVPPQFPTSPTEGASEEEVVESAGGFVDNSGEQGR